MTTSEPREGKGSDALTLLPFTITKVIQYGRKNPRYEMVLGDGVTVPVKNARMLLSGKKMREALFNAKHFLPNSVAKRWDEITEALIGLIVIEEIDNDEEEARR